MLAGSNGWHDSPPKINSRIILRNKKALEQVQICVGVPSYRISHEKRYASYILNTLLGGGMSSRLFQNVREKQGLVYSIFSELNPFRDTGLLSVYAGTSRESAPKVVRAIVSEFRQMKDNPVSDEELKRAKDQLKGSLMLSLESSTARMSNLARQEMYYDRFFGMDEIIDADPGCDRGRLVAVGQRIFPAGTDCGDRAGQSQRPEDYPRLAGLLNVVVRHFPSAEAVQA